MNFIKRQIARIVGLGWLGDVGKWMNGKKTVTGSLALLIHVLEIVPNVFPECGHCPMIAGYIQEALKHLGVSLVGVGVAHKAVK